MSSSITHCNHPKLIVAVVGSTCGTTSMIASAFLPAPPGIFIGIMGLGCCAAGGSSFIAYKKEQKEQSKESTTEMTRLVAQRSLSYGSASIASAEKP